MMPRKKTAFQWLKRTIRFNRIMTLVMLFLLFIYGVPLFPIPLFLNIFLRLDGPTTSLSVDDIRLRYNILTATPELILKDVKIGDENITSMVIGLNSHWSLNNKNNKKIEETDGGHFPTSLPSIGKPNYWEDPKSFAIAPTNAIFSYVIVYYGAIRIPFVVRDLLISHDEASPLGVRLDGFWQIDKYRGNLSFSKKNDEQFTLDLKSNKFNLLSVLEKFLENEESGYLKNYFNFASLQNKKNSFEEFAVDGKIKFDDKVSFQLADIKILSAKHYLETSIIASEQRTDILLRWDLANLQTLLSPALASSVKLKDINTKGSLAFYSITAARGGLSGFGIGSPDEKKNIKNQFELLADFSNKDLKSLNLQVAMTPNGIEEKATDYAFQGIIDASKDEQEMTVNTKLSKLEGEYHAAIEFNESLQAVCLMFNFCDDIPANLIWGGEFSKVKGKYNIHANTIPQNFYSKVRGWRKIYFSLAALFEETPDFEVPFMNFNVKAGSKTSLSMNGNHYGNLLLIEKATISNDNGLSAVGSDLQIKNGFFVKGKIESKVGNNKKSAFTVDILPDGSRKMEVVGDRVSFAPYLGFSKDRNEVASPVDFLDRHIDGSKLPNLYLVAKVAKLRLHGDHEWNNANLTLIIRDQRLEFTDFKSDEMTLFYKVGDKGDAVLRVDGSYAGEMFNGLGVLSGIEGGDIKFSAKAKNADEPLIGEGQVNNFVVNQLGGVAKLFDLLSITGLFSGNRGVGFDKATTSAKMFEQQIIFQNGVMTGPSMEMTFSGRLDLLEDKTNIEGTYVPKNFITSLLDFIPVLNIILPMSGDNAALGTRYVMTGAVDALKVRFNIGTALTPGILRGIFGKPLGSQDFIKRDSKEKAKAAAESKASAPKEPPPVKP